MKILMRGMALFMLQFLLWILNTFRYFFISDNGNLVSNTPNKQPHGITANDHDDDDDDDDDQNDDEIEGIFLFSQKLLLIL